MARISGGRPLDRKIEKQSVGMGDTPTVTMKRVSLDVTPEQYRKIKLMALETGRTVATILRDLIEKAPFPEKVD